MDLVFYSPSTGHALDEYLPEQGRGRWGQRTLTEQRAQDGADVCITSADYALHMQELRACTAVRVIDDDRALYLLEVLPPLDWERTESYESWAIPEFTTGRVTCQVVRLGATWYSFEARIMRHAARVQHVRFSLAEANATEAPARAH